MGWWRPVDIGKDLKEAVCGILSAIGGFLFVAGVIGGLIVLGYQVYVWLYTGEWMPLPISLFFGDPPYWNEGWIGIHKIIVWLLKTPLSLAVFVVGFTAGGAFYQLGELED